MSAFEKDFLIGVDRVENIVDGVADEGTQTFRITQVIFDDLFGVERLDGRANFFVARQTG